MKSSSPIVIAALMCVNLIPAGMGITDYLIRSHQESELMATMPADFRYGLPRHREPIVAQSVPKAPMVAENSGKVIDGR